MSAELGHDDLLLLVHEVKSPVAALAAIADAVAYDDLDDAARRELLRLAVEASRSVERIVRDLAALGSLHTEVVDVGRVVADAAAAAALGGGDVRAEIPSSPMRISVDPVRFRQALDNLIVNALFHGSGVEPVVVRAAAEGDAASVSVADRGPGIAVKDHARIFESGVRLDERRPGSGLGLAVVRAIVEAHGGSLRLDSSPGEGSTFTITLPRVQD